MLQVCGSLTVHSPTEPDGKLLSLPRLTFRRERKLQQRGNLRGGLVGILHRPLEMWTAKPRYDWDARPVGCDSPRVQAFRFVTDGARTLLSLIHGNGPRNQIASFLLRQERPT